MTTTTSELDSLRSAIIKTPGRKDGSRRYSKALRDRIVDYAEARLIRGNTIAAVARDLGLSNSVLHHWLRAKPRRKAPKEPPQLVRVQVTVPAPNCFQLKGPGGFFVDGLSAANLADIMAACDARQ